MNIDPNAAETPSLAESSYESRYYASIALNENYQPSRLGIIHILAWIVVSILLIAFNIAILTFQEGGNSGSILFRFANMILSSVQSIMVAANLVGGVVIAIDFLQGKTGRFQPGHWIVTIIALLMPLFFLSQAFGLLLEKTMQANHPFFVSYILFSGIEFMMMLSYFWGAFRLKEPLRWKCGLGMLGLVSGFFCLHFLLLTLRFSSSFGEMFNILQYVKSFVCFLMALFVFLFMIMDISKGTRRDWLHWVGAASPIVSAMIQIVWQLAAMFLIRFSGF